MLFSTVWRGIPEDFHIPSMEWCDVGELKEFLGTARVTYLVVVLLGIALQTTGNQ